MINIFKEFGLEINSEVDERYHLEKATEAASKFKAIQLWYVLALILVLAFIPWPFRSALGAGWF